MPPQKRKTEAKSKKWDYIKLKSIFIVKKITKTKRQPTKWKKIFANIYVMRGQYPKYIKSSYKSTTKNKLD